MSIVTPTPIQEALNGPLEDRFQSYIKDRRIGATTGLGMLVAKAIWAGDYPIAIVASDYEGAERILSIAEDELEGRVEIDRKRVHLSTERRVLEYELIGRHYSLIVADEINSRTALSILQKLRAKQTVHFFDGSYTK